jgi:hypothetical protein
MCDCLSFFYGTRILGLEKLIPLAKVLEVLGNSRDEISHWNLIVCVKIID